MLEQTNEIAIDAELESTPEVSDVTRRITRTVVTSTNYSTSGIVGTLSIDGLANVDDIDFYDASESFNSNVVLSSESQSIAQLDRAQDDLNNFRRRIDANIEEQREHADLMAGLQRKVEEYRRRVAEIENQIGTHKIDERVVFNLIEADSEPWTPDLKSLGTDYEISNRLEEEHRRVDELRLRLEQSRMQIVQLQGENQHLKQQFEITLREKERMYQMRERHLEQYLNEEQKKMMDLWTELQQVRRQCSEYKDQTERDLENQRNEFLKVMRSVGGVARQLNLSAEGGGFHSLLSENSSESGAVINHDTVLVEAMKRFYDQQAAPFKSVDIGLHDELIKKYEEAIERIIELESRGDGNSGKLATFESELKSTREKLIEYQEVLRKVHDLSREAGRHSDIAKRTRSLSPSGTLHAAPSEVLRSVRQVIRARDNELQQLQRRLKVAETEVAEMTARFESAEEARRKFEKQLNDSKKELNIQMKAVENANRDLKRLEERLRTTEAGKSSLESVNKHLNDEIRNFKMMYEQSTAEIERKVLEEADERYHIIEEEHKTRIRELTHRIDGLTDDNKRLKSDLNGVKDKYRNIESEYNNTLLKIEEKDQALKHLEDLRDDLLKDLENQRARFDAVTNELDNLQANFSVSTKNTVAIEMTIKEVKQQRDEISAQKEELSQELVELKHQMEIEFKKRKDMEKVCQCHIGDIEKLQTQVTEYEGQLMILRRHNDDLDTQIKTSHAKISTLENSLASSQKEIGKLTELNMKLQKEKQDLMNMRQKMDNDLDGLKEKLRKTEIEIEKLRNESKISVENEEKIELAYKEEVSRVRLLQKELEEAKFEIENSQRRLKQFEQENKDRLELVLRTKASSSEKSETFESSELIEIRIKELKDRHKLDVEKLENERGELIRRMQLLDDEHAEKERTIEQQLSEIDALKAQHEIEIERLKAEITSLETKYQNELEDERDQYNHNMELAKNTEEELRRKLTTLEKELKDANNNESALQNEGIIWEEKYDTITKELENVREYMGNIRADSEVEIQKWKNDANAAHIEIKNFEVTVETLKAQLMGANERVNSLNKTVSEQAAKIRELSAQIRRLEDELEDAKAIVATHETDLDNALNRLRSIEEQYGILQLENTKLRAEIDSLNRLLDTSKNKNASYEKDVERLKRKLVVLSVTTKEQVSELETRKNEHDQLDKSHRDKSRQIDQLKELIKTFEAKNERLRQELQNTSDKLIVAEADRNSLRNELKKLQQELQFGRDQMLRKTDEFHVALEGLANAHRTSEDGRVNALQELETKKFEISDLESRLENAEQRLATLQQEYINVDKERDVLNDSLRRFQAVITRCASVIPEGGEVVTGPVDVQTIDVHVQKLMNRVEKLEREKNEYRDSLSRLKRKNSDSHVAINKSETFYRSIEERVADVEEERRAAEVKLTSAKQLLRSQEEALKLRDEERHQMRSKIVAFELETRGKEAQLRHLNELVKTLRAELEAAQNDVRRLREREEQWDTNKFQLESKMRDHDGETQRVSMLMATFETERQSLNESLKKLASQLQASESKNADLKDDVDKLKRDLTKAERTEAELRRNLDEQTHLAQAAQHLNEQLTTVQTELATASNRKQQLEIELSNVRAELRDHKQHLRDAINRLSDLQRQLQDSHSEKNRLSDKIFTLEKTISSQRSTENDLRQQLSTASSERKTLQTELDDIRRRIEQFESAKHSAHEKIDELSKIRITLLKRIETLEKEKRGAESVISETALQREAIERSLSALERENKELYRNCAQLQQQIAQLEMDNGNRLIALTNKQKEEHERFVQSVRAEKAQVEKIIENRDRTQKNRIKQLENQLAVIRGQLNNERLKRRDATDRILISDMSKLGGSVFGLNNSGISSASTGYAFAQGLDYTLSHNAYSSHYTSPPSFKFAPVISSPVGGPNIPYRTTSTPFGVNEPAEAVQETYAATFHMKSASSDEMKEVSKQEMTIGTGDSTVVFRADRIEHFNQSSQMINVFANIFKVPVMRQSAIKMSLRLASTEATFQTKPFKLHKLDSGPDIDVHVTKEDAVRYYTQMQTIRRMESASGNLYKEKKVRGFCHLYSGQEACAVGTKAAMDAGDAAITSYRCHGWMYLSGSSVAKLLCELTGRVTGTVCGKGGSMHVYGEKFYGGNGIVGAQQPLGTGIAFAMKYRKEKNVCITVFGDGAANQGQLFESMNMAKLWDLPVVYVCENNGYGMGTAAARAAANTDYYTRGDYVPGIWVDGMDVLAVRQAIRWAKEWCNAGKGPLMIEMATYRYGGHSMSDPGTSYRTREEIQEVRKTRDPIVGFKDKIVTAGLVTEDDLKEIDKQVRMEIDDAVKQAHTDKEPPMDLLLTDIYYNTPAQYVRCTTNEVLQKYLTSEEAVKALAK